jgi:preprotein translocase subunit Sec63
MKKGKQDKKDKQKNNTNSNNNKPEATWTEQLLEESLMNEVRKKAWNFGLISFLIVCVIMVIYFQYRFERSRRHSVVMNDDEENFYDILGVGYDSDLPTLRKKYKELAKIWHPDKNVGCKSCQEKFTQISRAYEVLSDEAKKGEYDNKGGKSIFKSQPVILTAKNYHQLVEESNDFWVICVYENTRGNKHNQYIADAWDEVASKYKNIVKFGIIDVLQNENLLHFLPFKFQYYPNIMTYLHGEGSELFQNIESYSVKSKIIK